MKPVRIPCLKMSPYSIYYELPGDAVGDPDMIIAELVASVGELRKYGEQTQLRMDPYNTLHGSKVFANPIDPHVISGWHRHDFFELSYVFSGNVYEYIEDSIIVLEQGNLLVMNPNVFHALYAPPGTCSFNILVDASFFRENIERMNAHFRGGALEYIASHNAYAVFSSIKKGVLDDAVFEIVSMFTQYINLPHEALRKPASSPQDVYLLQRNAEALLARVCACEAAGEITVIRRGSTLFTDKFDTISEYIRANFATVNAEDTAKRFGYSRMQLYRIIKAHFGMSFQQYVMSLRLSGAKTLLTETDDDVSKICRSVGLSEEYFYRFFKKLIGVTPAKFRSMSEAERKKLPVRLPDAQS